MSQKRSCAELGLCQGDRRCGGCTYDDSGLGEFDYPHSPAPLPPATPRHATPRHGAPRHATPRHATPLRQG